MITMETTVVYIVCNHSNTVDPARHSMVVLCLIWSRFPSLHKQDWVSTLTA